MSNWNKNSGFGAGLVGFVRTIVPTFGNILVVMSSSDSDEANYHHVQEIYTPDPDGLVTFYTSLSAAYDAAESNNNDVILLDANSAHSLTEMLTVSKNRVHFIGMDGGGRLKTQGARISMGVTTDTDDIAAIYVTGVRNSFRNLKIYTSNTLDENLSCVIDGGEGTYWENCSIQKVSKADANGCDLWAAGDSCNYRHCEFGAGNVQNSVAHFVVKIDAKTGAGSDRLKDCVWEDCLFEIQSASGVAATSCFIKVVDNAAIYFNNIFKNCVFAGFTNSSNGGAILTDAFLGAASTTGGTVILANPTIYGATGVGAGSGYGFQIAAGGLAPDANGGLAIEVTD